MPCGDDVSSTSELARVALIMAKLSAEVVYQTTGAVAQRALYPVIVAGVQVVGRDNVELMLSTAIAGA